jgi:hypothetical protein
MVEVHEYSTDIREPAKRVSTFPSLGAFLKSRISRLSERRKFEILQSVAMDLLFQRGVDIIRNVTHELSIKAHEGATRMANESDRRMRSYVDWHPTMLLLRIRFHLS